MVKIAISGKANSGKNTVAQFLGTNLCKKGEDFKVLAFADPIKNMIMSMYPTTNPEILWGPSELRMTKVPGTNITFRQLLTDLGKLGRSYNVNVWIDATIAMANKYAEDNIKTILSDCRFSNELKAVKKDFFLIRVVRPNNAYGKNIESKDISEIDLDGVPDSDFDEVIVNDCSLQELENKIKELVIKRF
jgi:hypothetical protein